MAMGGPPSSGLGQQGSGGLGQFFRGDLPKKLGILLVRALWQQSSASFKTRRL